MTEEITAYCIRCHKYHALIEFEGAPLDEHEMLEEED
jgi:hypothetical protein